MRRPEPDGGGLVERKKGTQTGNWEKELHWILQPKSSPEDFSFLRFTYIYFVRGGSSSLHPGFSLVAVSGGYSLVPMQGLLIAAASLVSELGFSSCSA